MEFSMATLARMLSGNRPEVICSKQLWNGGMEQLRLRTQNSSRESGAFLLGTTDTSSRWIEEFVYYDDIDPQSLESGIVNIDGRNLGALWDHCRRSRRKVVADVHVHPRGFKQSSSDQQNPIIPEVGHIALIIPDFANKGTDPGRIGAYRYLGAFRWEDRSQQRPTFLHVGWWPRWL